MTDQTAGPQRMMRGRHGGLNVFAKRRIASLAQLGKIGGKSIQGQRMAVFSVAIDKQGSARRKQQVVFSIVRPMASDQKMVEDVGN